MNQKLWKCNVCGYIHEGDAPPDTCPVCGVPSEKFEETEPLTYKRKITKTWKCNVCGYIHEGDFPPDTCPVCAVPAEHFSPVEIENNDNEDTSPSLKIVIIGSGVAGMTAAKEASNGKNISVTVITNETDLPYYRLNLTRYLAGEVDKNDLVMNSRSWFEQNKVELIHGIAQSINVESKEISYAGESSKHKLSYDRLIIATGAHPFIPPIKGADKKNVFSLRTITDADNILEKANKNSSVVIIGGGLLGLEAAGALSRKGCSVTVLENYKWVLPRQLNETAGNILMGHLGSKNINVLTMAQTKEISGDTVADSVILEDETIVKADIILISTGIRSNSYLARTADIKVDKGILADDTLLTSNQFIYAAGDCTEHRGTMYGIWPAAYIQGKIAGINASGGNTPFTPIKSSNRLKVLDVDLFSIGMVNVDDGSFMIHEINNSNGYYRVILKDGLISGALLLGDTSLASKIQEAADSAIPFMQINELVSLFKVE
ncbi:MAG: FAD-dependent oxidoreductase [Deltaproteobacteria bacterium]|nr:FAD-dependent oxidoreductase [Deltaproteobacteria bacterium]